MTEIKIRSIKRTDSTWIYNFLMQNWGGSCIISGGKKCYPTHMDGFIAETNERVGILSYVIADKEMEIILIEATTKYSGIGTALINSAIEKAKSQSCNRIHLFTTNDNLDALRFYQRRSFRIIAVHPESMIEARKIKPGIPEIGDYQIPMRDEIELEIRI